MRVKAVRVACVPGASGRSQSRGHDLDDGRYTLAALTDAGFDVVRAAAPTHLRAVRDVVLDRLDAEDRAALGRIGAVLGVQDFPPRTGSPHFRSGTRGTEEDGPPVR